MHTDEFTNTNTNAATVVASTSAVPARSVSWWARVAGAALVSTLVVTGAVLPAGALSNADADSAATAEPSAVTFDRHVASFPDEIAAHAGGVAARLHDAGQVPVPGDVFALFATDGSDRTARLFDTTAYTLVRPDVHPEMVASNVTAAAVVAEVVGHEVPMVEFTSAPAGGFSAGLTFAIGYLNAASDGAFTGGLRIASTGTLDDDGYVDWVTAIDEKTAAAHLAGVDVMFTSAKPSFSTVDSYGARFEGELYRARRTGAALTSERNWSGYELLGAQRPTAGMDIVAVAHLGDVAAYLCGAGSDFACEVRAAMDNTTIGATAPVIEEAKAADADPAQPASGVGVR